ncbi:MAG: hypothetical protein QXU73_00705 [Thermoplasmata archaeon]
MNKELEKSLMKFYEGYRYQLETAGKLKPDASLLLTCLKMKKNDRYRPLAASAIDGNKIPPLMLAQLKEQRLIRSGEDVARYVITGRGIWEIERSKNLIDENTLLDFIDANYFGQLFEDARPLSDKEKVVLLAMIAARAFCEESSVDMKRDPQVNAAWLEVFKLSADKLRSIGAITATDEDLFSKNLKYEDTASHFIRHTDQLPRKTRAMFTASKRRVNQYFLQVSKDGVMDTDRLAYLIWLIAGKNLGPDTVEDFFSFCTSIAYDYSVRLFDHEKHVFARPHYDGLLRDAIIDSVISRHKWETSGK